MKVIHRWSHAFNVLFLGYLMLSSVSIAAAQELELESLRGIEGFAVVVEKVPEDLRRIGLSRQAIGARVKLHLRRENVVVLTDELTFDHPRSPYLYITVNGLESRGNIIFSVSVNFRQLVQLNTSDERLLPATTWSTGSVGTVQRDLAKEAIYETVEDEVNIFLAGLLLE